MGFDNLISAMLALNHYDLAILASRSIESLHPRQCIDVDISNLASFDAQRLCCESLLVKLEGLRICGQSGVLRSKHPHDSVRTSSNDVSKTRAGGFRARSPGN